MSRLENALFAALKRHQLDRVRELLERGADVNQRDEHGSTPLDHAISDDDLPSELVGELLARGAEPDAIDMDGNTALMVAETPLLPLLIAHGANANARDRAGDTPLIQAASYGDVARLEILLDHGADVDAVNGRSNALIAAVEAGEAENVRLLLARGADVRPPSGCEWMAVILAAASGDTDRVLRLLDQGEFLNIRTLRGDSALTWALKMGHLKTGLALKRRGAEGDE